MPTPPTKIKGLRRGFVGLYPPPGRGLNAKLLEALPPAARVQTSMSPAERIVFRHRKMVKPSAWVTKHRIIKNSAIPGPWKHSFSPYMAPLMDACRFPSVETCIICKSPQTGGSEACLNLLAHAIDHFPGPALIVYPDRDTAKEVARDRLMPMLEDSPRLRRYLTGDAGDESSIRVSLRHMVIYLGWSGSVSRLGSKPIRTLILDELDKYANSAREADSQALAEKRTITWEGRRRLIMKISTPTTENGPIWVAYNEEANARFNWQVVCPLCGAPQVMDFDHVKWPADARDPELVLKDRLAYYECAKCGGHWDDDTRLEAIRAGYWVEAVSGQELFSYLESHRPLKIGFHIPAWLSYFVPLSAAAHAFLKYNKTRKLADLKDFMNQYKAEAWAETLAAREEQQILRLCDDRPRGAVPGPVDGVPRVAGIVAGVDTQAHYFRWVIRAFGFGSDEESWLIQCGSSPSFEALDKVLWGSVYRDGEGNAYAVSAAVIDAMGYPGRTKAVYAWCAKHRGKAIPYQGKQTLSGRGSGPQVGYSNLEYYPGGSGEKIRIPGGILLRRVDTTFFKSDLAEKLMISPGDPGCFHLHSNTIERAGAPDSEGILDQYAAEMCAEVFNPEKLIWENPKNRPNHYWDCEVMALVAAWELGLRNIRPPEPEAPEAPAGSAAVQRYATNAPAGVQQIARRSAGERLAILTRRRG